MTGTGLPPPFKALIFDLDGTLADTDPVHFRAFGRMLAEHGKEIDEDFYRRSISGRANKEVFASLFPEHEIEEHARLAAEKEASFRSIAGDLLPVRGLLRLLDWADEEGLGLALVSNAPRENIAHVTRVLKIEQRFPVVVFGDELERSKPDPLPYLTAVGRLGVRPEEAMAFEDSVPGIVSARGAGLMTVGLTTTQPADALLAAGADATIRDFEDDVLWKRILGNEATGESGGSCHRRFGGQEPG